jgi:hypothetical protein
MYVSASPKNRLRRMSVSVAGSKTAGKRKTAVIANSRREKMILAETRKTAAVVSSNGKKMKPAEPKRSAVVISSAVRRKLTKKQSVGAAN